MKFITIKIHTHTNLFYDYFLGNIILIQSAEYIICLFI